MEQFQIKSPDDFGRFFDYRKENLKEIMNKEIQEIIDNEFNLTELNLSISSIGKDNIKEATEKVRELREKVDKEELDLSKYEDMAEEF